MSSAIERQQQSVGPRSTADRLAGIAIGGGFRLELGHFVAKNEGLRSKNPVDGLSNFRSNRLVLGDKIDERDSGEASGNARTATRRQPWCGSRHNGEVNQK